MQCMIIYDVCGAVLAQATLCDREVFEFLSGIFSASKTPLKENAVAAVSLLAVIVNGNGIQFSVTALQLIRVQISFVDLVLTWLTFTEF